MPPTFDSVNDHCFHHGPQCNAQSVHRAVRLLRWRLRSLLREASRFRLARAMASSFVEAAPTRTFRAHLVRFMFMQPDDSELRSTQRQLSDDMRNVYQ